MLRNMVVLIGGLPPPRNNLGDIPVDPSAFVVHDADIVLCDRVSFLCQLGPVLQRRCKFTLLIGAPSIPEIGLGGRGEAEENKRGGKTLGSIEPLLQG